VEDFDALKVVYWIQDIATKEVWQAGVADPNPSWTGITEYDMTDISVYPNPVTNQFTVTSEEPMTKISVVNLFGQTVLEVLPSDNQYEINASAFASGLYLIHVATGNGVSTKKVVVQ
jgi:hypothetical protein